MCAHARIRITRGEEVDERPVDGGRRGLRGACIADEVVMVAQACHESIEQLSGGGDLRSVVGERIAEAQAGEGGDHQMEGNCILAVIDIGLGEQFHQVSKRKVREGKRWNEQKRDGVGGMVLGRHVDEVHTERRGRVGPGAGDGDGGSELRRLVQKGLLVAPRILLQPEVDEWLDLRLGLPPVLRNGLRALVWKARELKLLAGKLEVLA